MGALYDLASSLSLLEIAWRRVWKNKGCPGCDGMSVSEFYLNADAFLKGLHNALRSETYRPMPLRLIEIPKPNGSRRKLGIPTVLDRIVQTSVSIVLQELWGESFPESCHAYLKGRGVRTALERVALLVRSGKRWAVKSDVKDCFDSLKWNLLLRMLENALPDAKLISLIQAFLEVPFIDPKGRLINREEGVPQGSPISPLLCNLYLLPFDVSIEEYGYSLTRYGDDWIILTDSESEARESFNLAREILKKLSIKPNLDKSKIINLERESVEFLGYSISACGISLSEQNYLKLRESLERYLESRERLRGYIRVFSDVLLGEGRVDDA